MFLIHLKLLSAGFHCWIIRIDMGLEKSKPDQEVGSHEHTPHTLCASSWHFPTITVTYSFLELEAYPKSIALDISRAFHFIACLVICRCYLHDICKDTYISPAQALLCWKDRDKLIGFNICRLQYENMDCSMVRIWM